VRATTAARASCPQCRATVIAKCGEHVIHHWAHKSSEDCDAWSEGETAWHLEWKQRFPACRTEVVMGDHRADVVGVNGCVLEIQHSALSSEVIREREAFYGNMVWLWDARSFWERISVRHGRMFTWTQWRPTMGACSLPIFLDFQTVRRARGVLFRIDRLERAEWQSKDSASTWTSTRGDGEYVKTGDFVTDINWKRPEVLV